MMNMVAESLARWCISLAGQFMASIGVGGMVALIAGGLLLLSLSARAAKFLTSPAGMATGAAVVLAALALMRSGGTQATPAVAESRPVASRPPAQKPAEIQAQKLEPAPEAPLLASRVGPAPVENKAAFRSSAEPFFAVAIVPPVTFQAPIVPVVTPRILPPIVVPPKQQHTSPAHPASKPARAARRSQAQVNAIGTGNRPSATTANRQIQNSGASPKQASGRAPAGQQAASSGHATPQALRQQQIRQANAAANQQMNMMMHQMIQQQTGGMGMHPGMGPHPMGGMPHPGAMHHTGGHN